jgi:hypothetical protein
LVVLTAICGAGCERPTAPQVRDGVEKGEVGLLSGNTQMMQASLRAFTDIAVQFGYGGNPDVPRDSITITRRGSEKRMGATVVERMYLPPARSGGRPFVRRSVFAWSNEGTDARMRVHLLMLLSNDTVSSIDVPNIDNVEFRRSKPMGFAIALDPGNRGTWFGTAGQLRVSAGDRVGDCPYVGKFSEYSTGFAELQNPTLQFTCEKRRYAVSVSGMLERGDPNDNSIVDRLVPETDAMEMSVQQIPGVRFITQCIDGPDASKNAPGCWDYLDFWRESSQFASELGVDVAAMQRIRPGDGYVCQVVSSGTGPDLGMGAGVVRYRVYTPQGQILGSRDRSTVETDSLLRRIPVNDIPHRAGSRVLIIIPASYLQSGAGAYAVVVADVTFLPVGRD